MTHFSASWETKNKSNRFYDPHHWKQSNFMTSFGQVELTRMRSFPDPILESSPADWLKMLSSHPWPPCVGGQGRKPAHQHLA